LILINKSPAVVSTSDALFIKNIRDLWGKQRAISWTIQTGLLSIYDRCFCCRLQNSLNSLFFLEHTRL